jgi:hypothetical protein
MILDVLGDESEQMCGDDTHVVHYHRLLFLVMKPTRNKSQLCLRHTVH